MCYSGCPYERRFGHPDRHGECKGSCYWKMKDAHCYEAPEKEEEEEE